MMKTNELENPIEPKIYGVRFYRYGNGCYSFSFRHTGDFHLNDFDEIELTVVGMKLLRRK